ncbi:MAG: L-rhamnose mutarotase [Blautia sp.]|nr:L-rhamnose mutarotase [Blautia sp.]MDY5665448.1 L-rhamnose mutarotase [Blautia sp.]
MERHAFAMEVKEGRKDDYRKALGKIWPELTAFLDRNEIKNFSIWNTDSLIFGYYEKADGSVLSAEEKEISERLTKEIEDTFTWISTPGQDMRLMYHDFGIVRESKELIRHRMFMTKLKPGCEEEYKRRHDGLVEQRGDTVNPGPDSNFSIWSAGGYIFGYDEIDTTMEKEPDEAARETSVAWETRQLGIMDWITNDMDWLTGEHHSASVRLAWHEGK